MDDLLAQERAAQEYVKSLQSHAELPFQTTLDAFTTYRSIVQTIALADIAKAESSERRLWDQHVETRQLLARTLRDLRKRQDAGTVEVRVATEMYLRFLKQSIRFYRKYIYQLSITYGGIPELERVAQQVKSDQTMEQDSSLSQPELRSQVLRSCQRSLIYLGDLNRYRASDNLDKTQDYGPALGFYNLSCTLLPQSGWGHNQQALVALENKQYLQATFHLYKSLLVAEPVGLAKKSLTLHFERSNAAWDRGELVHKPQPGGADATKHAITGLFVRLHSICFSGQEYRGYAELEHELLNRLSTELRTSALTNTLRRMVFVNIGAQHVAMDNYREDQSPQNELAFYYFMRINVVFFTAMLDLFRQDLIQTAKNPSLVDSELADKLKPIMLRVLPSIRSYSAWLLLNHHLLLGLASNDFVGPSIQSFWFSYAQTIDLVAHCFPIWDLEDAEEVTYMLEEDAEAFGYLPMDDVEGPKLVRKLFVDMTVLKPKESYANVATRLSAQGEALARILSILEFGSYIASDLTETPIFIRGSRFVLGAADAEPFNIELPPKPEPAKPLSYAAAAAKLNAERAKQNKKTSPPAAMQTKLDGKDSSQTSSTSQDDAQLSRMVDSLVEDDDADHPATPPQQWTSNPAIVASQSELFGLPSLAPSPKLDVDMIDATLIKPSPTVITKQISTRKHVQKRSEDLSDFSPRPRPASGQLWSPSSPQMTPTSAIRRSSNSPLQSPNVMVRSPHHRVSSSNSIHLAVPKKDILAASSTNENVSRQRTSSGRKATMEIYTPTSSNASPERVQWIYLERYASSEARPSWLRGAGAIVTTIVTHRISSPSAHLPSNSICLEGDKHCRSAGERRVCLSMRRSWRKIRVYDHESASEMGAT